MFYFTFLKTGNSRCDILYMQYYIGHATYNFQCQDNNGNNLNIAFHLNDADLCDCKLEYIFITQHGAFIARLHIKHAKQIKNK